MNVREVLPRDAIPSIDDPSFGPDYFGTADDEVVVVNGDPPRAYPLRILGSHEIVNDTIDGRPIAVTWCPICWSVAVYDRTVDGRTLTFGVSGKLADDALVLYDRETGSEWRQPSGECLSGELAGQRLTALPATTTTYDAFRERYPDGLVLEPVRGGPDGDASALRAAYDMASYHQYREGEHFGLYGMRGEGEPRSWDRADIDAKTVVLGVERDGEAVGYPLPAVERAGGVLVDTVGETPLIVVLSDGQLRAFEHPVPGADASLEDGRLRVDGTTWDPLTGESEDGREMIPVPAKTLFAFAWQDDHGPDALYGN